MAVLYGVAPVLECLKARRRDIHKLIVKEGKPNPRIEAILEEAARAGVRVEEAGVQSLGDRTHSESHQGVALEVGELPVFGLEAFLEADPHGHVTLVAVDQIEDPQNLGGIVRSAAFLGAQALLTARTRTSPLSPAASKASAGALEFFPVVEVPNLAQALTALEEDLFRIWGADSGEEAGDYRELEPADRQVLILGNEGRGLRALTRKRCHQLIRIPGGPGPDSLNVSVSAGILLAHLVRPGAS